MEVKHCHSCAMPLDAPTNSGPKSTYCSWCLTPEGTLKSRNDVQQCIAQWMTMWQPGLTSPKALQRAENYMNGMPAWAP